MRIYRIQVEVGHFRVCLSIMKTDGERKPKRKYNRKVSHTNLCGLDFVACAAAPSCEVWEDLALLTLHTRLHLAPPLLGYDGG